jgi:transposase
VPAVSLLTDADRFRLDDVHLDANAVTVTLTSTQPDAVCPQCGRSSARVQSRYTRSVADLPAQGAAVRLALHVRRFVCENAECPRKIFAERLPTLAAVYARHTQRLVEAVRALGFTAGGEAGARLAAKLGIRVSPDTILNRVRSAPLPAAPPPRVVGIDDFAMRRGKTYGTIVVDLERRRPIDLLGDRTAETVAARLRQMPGVEVVTRDRAQAYADAARQGAPDAVQVADRWHLIRNAGKAVERVLDRHRSTLKAAAETLATREPAESEMTQTPDVNAAPTRPLSRTAEMQQARRQRRRDRYEEVVTLYNAGMTRRAIARQLGMTRRTVRRFLNSEGSVTLTYSSWGSTTTSFPFMPRCPNPQNTEQWKVNSPALSGVNAITAVFPFSSFILTAKSLISIPWSRSSAVASIWTSCPRTTVIEAGSNAYFFAVILTTFGSCFCGSLCAGAPAGSSARTIRADASARMRFMDVSPCLLRVIPSQM